MQIQLCRLSAAYANILLFLLASQTGSWSGYRKTRLYQRAVGPCAGLWDTGVGRVRTCSDQIHCGQLAEQQEGGSTAQFRVLPKAFSRWPDWLE